MVFRTFIALSVYKEIVKKYDIDGLRLDYVRYPDGKDGSNDFGYDEYTKQDLHSGPAPAGLRPAFKAARIKKQG